MSDKKFDISEFFKIKRAISQCDSFYAALYGLAHIAYSEAIETACVTFDKKGNALEMKINPHFWSTLEEDEKTFVILHELYHVVYDHAKRIIALEGDFKIGNIASDIVINHHIDSKLGVYRDSFDWQKYCWVETCFKDSIEPNDKSFEYYYNRLKKLENLPENKLLGNHEDNEDKKADTADNKGSQEESEKTDANKDRNDAQSNDEQSNDRDNDRNKESTNQENPHDNGELNKETPDGVLGKNIFTPDDFSDDIKDILEQNPEIAKELENSPDMKNLGNEIKQYTTPAAPLGRGKKGRVAEFVEAQEKPQFAKLMALLIPKKKDDGMMDSWVGNHRRYESFLKMNPHVRLPNQMERIMPGRKKEVWVFMDSSGSCHGMFHAFSNIVVGLLKEKKINCRAFDFGDSCDEIDAKNINISFHSGNDGGFDCIEEKILQITNNEKIAYPDNVVVLSDGGVRFRKKDHIKMPKNWILLINNEHSQKLTPPGGRYIHMAHDFFGKTPLNASSSKKYKF